MSDRTPSQLGVVRGRGKAPADPRELRAAIERNRQFRCDGCGNRITVEPWEFEGYVTHPNRRCADVAAGELQR